MVSGGNIKEFMEWVAASVGFLLLSCLLIGIIGGLALLFIHL